MNNIQLQRLLPQLITISGVFLILIGYAIAGLQEWYFVAGMAVFVVVLYVVSEYLQSRSKYRIDKVYDERQARCQTQAARNGYLAAILAVGAVAVLYGAGYQPFGVLGMLSMIYVLVVSVQFLSYLYYLGTN